MSLIDIKNLTFAYEGSYSNIFTNTSLQLDTDWKLGLVGRNGKGKSTLFRLLNGGFEFSGKIEKTVEVQYFPFFVENTKVTVAELIYIINPYAEWWQVIKDLTMLGVDGLQNREFGTLSSGERVKVLLAILFSRENSFLLIDEPTNHLDYDGRKQLAEYLNQKSGYIIISHDRAFLDDCVDHILTIERQNIEVFRGNFSAYLEHKKAKDEREIKGNIKLKGEISALKESARRTADWADKAESSKYGTRNSGLRPDRGYIGAKAAKLMKRATCAEGRIEKLIDEKEGLLKNIDRKEKVILSSRSIGGKAILTIKDYSAKYGENRINQSISFYIENGERVSLVGHNGSGKSTLIKILLGENIEYDGEIFQNGRNKISYVPQEIDFLKGELDEYIEDEKLDKTKVFTILRKLGFERIQFEKRLEDYSDGQKKKLLIAKSLSEDATLYIWDEPLNHIDVVTREQIEELILESKATMIFVEHDRVFQDKVATKVVALAKFVKS